MFNKINLKYLKLYVLVYIGLLFILYIHDVHRFSLDYEGRTIDYIKHNYKRYWLLLLFLNHTWFILLNIKTLIKSKINVWGYVFLATLFIPYYKGLLNNPFSNRSLLDLYKPIAFLLLFQLFSILYVRNVDYFRKALPKLAKFLLYISVGLGIILIFFLFGLKIRPGTSLPILLPVAFFISHLKFTETIVSIFLVFLSGRRNHLLAIFPHILVFLSFVLSKKKARAVSLIAVVIMTILAVIDFGRDKSIIRKNMVYDKYKKTITYTKKAIEEDDLHIFDRATADRLSEVMSAFYQFKTIDYLFGKGVGYTYEWRDVNRFRVYRKKHTNINLAPASLIMSYGVFFMILFYTLFIKYIIDGFIYARKHKDKFILTFSLLASSFFIQSFFEFTVFTSFFLPISLGIIRGQILLKKNKTL